VSLEDITYSLRLANLRSLAVSTEDPDVAYLGSREGYVWRTADGDKTWDESRLITEPRPFYGDKGERWSIGGGSR